MMKKNLIFYSVLVLIASITPANAFQISEINNTLSNINTETSAIENASNEINIQNGQLNDSVDYIQDNWWKFWNWWTVGQKISQACKAVDEINEDVKTFATNSNEIKQDITRLNIQEQDLAEANNDSYQNAQYVVFFLEAICRDITISNPCNFTQGDLVQFKSQSKYYRYAEFLNQTNNSVTLKGKDKTVTISQKNFTSMATLKLTPTLKNPSVMQKVYSIQKDEIQVKKKHLMQVQDDMDNVMVTLTMIEAGLGVSFGISLILMCIIPPAGGYLAVITGIALAGVASAIIALGYVSLNINHLIYSDVDDELTDLDNYMDEFVNCTPVAENMNLTTNTSENVTAKFNVTYIDVNSLKFNIKTQPQHGNLTLNSNGTFTYIPLGNYTGNDTFTYSACDSRSESNIANVTITINPHVELIAKNETLNLTMNQNLTYILNSTNPNNREIMFKLVSTTEHGNLTLNSNGTFTYVPETNYTGTDSFTFFATDGLLNSSIAKLNIKITDEYINDSIYPVI